MDLDSHRQRIESLAFGKRLPGAVYVYRPGPDRDGFSPELVETIRRAEIAARPDASWNLLKIHTDQFAFTFLSYPDFDADPHPSLAEATKGGWKMEYGIWKKGRRGGDGFVRTRRSCIRKTRFLAGGQFALAPEEGFRLGVVSRLMGEEQAAAVEKEEFFLSFEAIVEGL